MLASAIAKYEWLVDGGFGSKVYNIAPKLDQADIIYNNIWKMTILDPEYQRMKEIYSEKDHQMRKVNDDSDLPKHRQTDLYVLATNSTVKKIAFSAKKSDGFNPSLAICDEIAAWSGDGGLKQYEGNLFAKFHKQFNKIEYGPLIDEFNSDDENRVAFIKFVVKKILEGYGKD